MEGFSKIPNALLRRTDLSPHAKLVYCVGASFLSNGDTDIFPSYGTLAKLSGLSRSTVIRAAKELVDAGIWSLNLRRNDATLRCESNIIRYLDRPLPSSTETHPSVTLTLGSSTGALPLVSQGNRNKNQSEEDVLKKTEYARSSETASLNTDGPTPHYEPAPALPGDDFNRAQAFFRGNATAWGRIVSLTQQTELINLLEGYFADGLDLTPATLEFVAQDCAAFTKRPRGPYPFRVVEQALSKWAQESQRPQGDTGGQVHSNRPDPNDPVWIEFQRQRRLRAEQAEARLAALMAPIPRVQDAPAPPVSSTLLA